MNKSTVHIWHSSSNEKGSNETPNDKKDLFTQADLPRYIESTQVTFCLQQKKAEASSRSFSENKHNILNSLGLKLKKKKVAEQEKTFYERNSLLVIWLVLMFLLRRAFSWLSAELTCHLSAVSPSPSSRGQSCLPAPCAPSEQSGSGSARSAQWDSGWHKLPTGSQLLGS